MSQLSPTYYDFMMRLRPWLVELAEADAADLLARPVPPPAVHSVDDFPSRFEQCFEHLDDKVLEDVARFGGVSASILRPHFDAAKDQFRAKFGSLYANANFEYHAALNFALAGKKAFHIADHLAEHLANTEINLKARYIELPFATCLFTYTARVVIEAMHNIRRDKGRPAAGRLGLDYAAPVSVFVTMLPAGKDLPGRKLLICAWHARPPAKAYLMLKREIYLAEEWSLEEALRTDWETLAPEQCGKGLRIDTLEDEIAVQDDDDFYNDGLSFYRIILNTLIYLSSNGAERVPRLSPRREMEARAASIHSLPKRKKAFQAANRFSSLDYEEVGASVGPIIVDPGRPLSDSGKGPGTQLQQIERQLIRGHWRRQPYGLEGRLRKIIRMEPYWRGPDLAAVINKPYLVK